MTVQIKGRHLQITRDIREYIESKLPRIEKYSDRVQKIEIVIEKDAYKHKVDLALKDGPVDVRAGTRDANLTRAIDSLVDKVEAQLKKKWAKKRGMTKRKTDEQPKRMGSVVSRRTTAPTMPAGTPKSPRANGRALTVGAAGVKVYPVEAAQTPVLTLAAAAAELGEGDDPFVYFEDKKSGSAMILYRRKDGHFGLVEPDSK